MTTPSSTELQPVPKNEMKMKDELLIQDSVNEWMQLRFQSLEHQGPHQQFSLFKGLVGYFSLGTEAVSSYHLSKLVCHVQSNIFLFANYYSGHCMEVVMSLSFLVSLIILLSVGDIFMRQPSLTGSQLDWVLQREKNSKNRLQQ